MDNYINTLRKHNYVCRIVAHGETRAVLFIDRRYATVEQAQEEFREEARRIKEEMNATSLDLVMHL